MEAAGRLPEPIMNVGSPYMADTRGVIDFMLFKKLGNDGDNYKVVSMDHTGRTLMYGYRFFCAANLIPSSSSDVMSPPVVHGLWKEYMQPPPEWTLLRSYAVYLGGSKFCMVRFFEVAKIQVCPVTGQPYPADEGIEAVITGVEVESSGQELQVWRHKSERYNLKIEFDYWVL